MTQYNFEEIREKRIKEALEVVAPNAIEISSTFGVPSENGFIYKSDNMTIYNDHLFGVVRIVSGPSTVFACNVDKKRVTLYKDGTWKVYFDKMINDKMKNIDVNLIKRNAQSRIGQNLGIPLP